MGDKYTLEYSYEEQIEDLSKVTGLSKSEIKRVLFHQRKFAQEKLHLGYAYPLRGIVKIEPKRRARGIDLTSKVAQAVPRPVTIKKENMLISKEEEFKSKIVEDEEFS